MGLYIFINEQDRKSMRSVTQDGINNLFQDALDYDESLMITEQKYTERISTGLFSSKSVDRFTYNIYHEIQARNGSAYQAVLLSSASGNSEVVIAYLHGIINGVIHHQFKTENSEPKS